MASKIAMNCITSVPANFCEDSLFMFATTKFLRWLHSHRFCETRVCVPLPITYSLRQTSWQFDARFFLFTVTINQHYINSNGIFKYVINITLYTFIYLSPAEVHGWSKTFSASAIDGNTTKQIFFFLNWYICHKQPCEIANHSIK
jgi:hypothetical protein